MLQQIAHILFCTAHQAFPMLRYQLCPLTCYHQFQELSNDGFTHLCYKYLSFSSDHSYKTRQNLTKPYNKILTNQYGQKEYRYEYAKEL